MTGRKIAPDLEEMMQPEQDEVPVPQVGCTTPRSRHALFPGTLFIHSIVYPKLWQIRQRLYTLS